MRAYYCGEGFLLGVTGTLHAVILVNLLLVELFVHPVRQEVLKCCAALVAAWESVNLVAAAFVLWRYAGRGAWLFELFHHAAGFSIAVWLMLINMPLEIHFLVHWAELQHSFVGAYRFVSWLREFDTATLTRWRERVTTAALIHDVSKIVTGIPAMAIWVFSSDPYSDHPFGEVVFVTCTCLLGNIVLLNHARKAYSLRAQEKALSEQNSTDMIGGPLSDTPRVSLASKYTVDDAMKKVRIDTRALDGLRGFAAFYIATNHFLYYTHWGGDFDPSSVAEWDLAKERWDLHGGLFLPLFYVLSGFVMTIGYVQTKWRLPGSDLEGFRSRCNTLLGRVIVEMLGGSTRRVFKETRGDAESEEMGKEVSAGGSVVKHFDACGFWRKRLWRLAPIYLLTNCAAFAGMCGLGVIGAVIRQQGYAVFVLWMAFWPCGLTSWMPSRSTLPPNPVTWTISTMFFFYLAFPVLIPYLQRMPAAQMRICALRMYLFRMPIGLLMGSFLWIKHSLLDSYWLFRALPMGAFPIFVMGCCCGLATLRDHAKAQEIADDPSGQVSKSSLFLTHDADYIGIRLMGLLLLIILFRRFGGLPHLSLVVRPLGDLLIPMVYYDLVKACSAVDHDHSFLGRALRSRLLQFLGDISMGLYMVHWPIMTIFSNLSFAYDPVQQHQSPVMSAWGGAAALPSSILFGWIVTRLVERTVGKLQRKADRPACATTDDTEVAHQSADGKADDSQHVCSDGAPGSSKGAEDVSEQAAPVNVEVTQV